MKINEALNSEKDYIERSEKFNNEVQKFAENHHITIYNGFDFIKVKPENTVEWTYELHKKLCECFGVKLIRAEHLILYTAAHKSTNIIDYPINQIGFIYVDETDTNHEELDFNEVEL